MISQPATRHLTVIFFAIFNHNHAFLRCLLPGAIVALHGMSLVAELRQHNITHTKDGSMATKAEI